MQAKIGTELAQRTHERRAMIVSTRFARDEINV